MMENRTKERIIGISNARKFEWQFQDVMIILEHILILNKFPKVFLEQLGTQKSND